MNRLRSYVKAETREQPARVVAFLVRTPQLPSSLSLTHTSQQRAQSPRHPAQRRALIFLSTSHRAHLTRK